jgi:hypothetical protein
MSVCLRLSREQTLGCIKCKKRLVQKSRLRAICNSVTTRGLGSRLLRLVVPEGAKLRERLFVETFKIFTGGAFLMAGGVKNEPKIK